MLKNPGVGEIDCLGQKRKIVPAEMCRLLSDVAVSVEAGDRDVVAVTLASLVVPDAHLDQAEG
jgi:hypothetical protein